MPGTDRKKGVSVVWVSRGEIVRTTEPTNQKVPAVAHRNAEKVHKAGQLVGVGWAEDSLRGGNAVMEHII